MAMANIGRWPDTPPGVTVQNGSHHSLDLFPRFSKLCYALSLDSTPCFYPVPKRGKQHRIIMPSLFATLKQHLDIEHPSQEPCDKTLDVRATTSFTSRCPGKPVGREFEEKKILIRDVHGQEGSFNFEKQGFSVMTLLDSNMSYEDFDDRAKVRAIYYREVEKALQQHLGADRVYFFGANVGVFRVG